MKIEIDIDEKYSDTEVLIRVAKLDADIEKLVAMMRMVNMQIGVRKGDETYLLDTEKILYIEAVDRRTFVYTEDETYESDLKLYEMERELLEHDFFRISKQSIVNIRMIRSLRSDINRKIRICLICLRDLYSGTRALRRSIVRAALRIRSLRNTVVCRFSGNCIRTLLPLPAAAASSRVEQQYRQDTGKHNTDEEKKQHRPTLSVFLLPVRRSIAHTCALHRRSASGLFFSALSGFSAAAGCSSLLPVRGFLF